MQNNHRYILDVVFKPYKEEAIDEAFKGRVVEHILLQEEGKLGIYFDDGTAIVIKHANHNTYDHHHFNKMQELRDLSDDERDDFGLISAEELKLRKDAAKKEWYESHARSHSYSIKHMIDNHREGWVQEQIAKWTKEKSDVCIPEFDKSAEVFGARIETRSVARIAARFLKKEADEVLKLEVQLASLRELMSHLEIGHQISIVALTELWKLLGVDNQTMAVIGLKELLETSHDND